MVPSFQPAQIGKALAGSGAVQAVISIFMFPWLQRRYNNRKLYTVLAAFWWPGFALMPIGHLVASWGKSMTKENADRVIWAAIILILIPIKIAVNVFP